MLCRSTPDRSTKLWKPSACDQTLVRYPPYPRQLLIVWHKHRSPVPALCSHLCRSLSTPAYDSYTPPAAPGRPPGLPRTPSNIGTLPGSTPHYLLCSRRSLHPPSVMFPSAPRLTPCPICAPRTLRHTPASYPVFPHRRQLPTLPLPRTPAATYYTRRLARLTTLMLIM